MIKIGVSACFMYPDPTRVTFGKKTLQYLEKDMSLYLSRPGVMPILIPDLPEAELLPFLAEMDGFVFQVAVFSGDLRCLARRPLPRSIRTSHPRLRV